MESKNLVEVEEKDLGVIVSNYLKVSRASQAKTRKTKEVLG